MSEVNRLRFMLGVAIVHMVLVALGASGVSVLSLGPLGQLIEDYYSLSGAGTGYGFFTSGVSVQNRARFDVIDGQGQKTTASLEAAMNREAELRVVGITTTFRRNFDDPGMQSALAASFARDDTGVG